ncbi:MAG TPA: M20/M25/M40 family metallo-hydrolase [Actinomycetes bacterium]|nr:M20/M25/M40 family metallo-hydrolase [Actinomycetes bacterium]
MSTTDYLHAPDADHLARVRAAVADGADSFVQRLTDWLRIPSISGDPAHHPDVRRSAEHLVDALRAAGFPTAEVWETSGLPAVFAHWPSDDPDAPTVVVYGHHDVQPVTPRELWRTDPFEPVIDGDRLAGRGSADDKGQVFFHLLGLDAHLAATGRTSPAVNLKLVVEGEEESGSPHFAELLRAHHAELGCDVVVVSDTGMWSRDTPTVCVGMRGMTDCQVDLRGPTGDVHSGSFGGAVPNPLTELARLLGRMHDDDLHVTIDGFYDGVLELSDDERALIGKLPYDELAWLGNARSSAPRGETGYSTLERVWARPTAEVNGMWGGYQGEGHKTIVPSEAHAKVSFRLVSGQEPSDVQREFEAWLGGQVPEGVEWSVHWYGPGVRPCLTPLDHPALESVTRAMSTAFGSQVLYTREGGSGPEADLQDVLEAPVVFLGVSLPDDGWHAPNEKVEIPFLLKGAEAAALLWDDLARTLPRTP